MLLLIAGPQFTEGREFILAGLAVAAALAIVFPVVLRMLGRGYRSRGRLQLTLRGRWNAQVVEGGAWSGDRVVLRVRGVNGVMTFADPMEHPEADITTGWTRIRFDTPSERLLRVVTQRADNPWTAIRRFLGVRAVTLGDASFDAGFRVEASDADWARDVLSPSLRRELTAFQERASWHGAVVAVDAGPWGLDLRFSRPVIDDADSLGSFVELGGGLAGRLRGPGLVMKPGLCPVCSGGLTELPTVCPSCRTPHHAECWTYLGRCAIFACGGR